jgi:hypothetical protein
MHPTRFSIALATATLALAACGGDPDIVETGEPAPAADSPTATGESESEGEQGQLVDYGVGQNGQYAAGVAVVENTADHGGQTVTVSMNFLDREGEILTTESQVESFAYAGQTIVLHVFADLGNPRAKVASVEPTLLVEDEGTFEESDLRLDPVESTEVRQQYGARTAKFLLTNPSSEPLQDLRVGVLCVDDAGTIIGGGSTYPDLIAPNGQAALEADVTVSGEPASCTAYPSPAGF